MPLQWKCGVLTTGSLGKSQNENSYILLTRVYIGKTSLENSLAVSTKAKDIKTLLEQLHPLLYTQHTCLCPSNDCIAIFKADLFIIAKTGNRYPSANKYVNCGIFIQ